MEKATQRSMKRLGALAGVFALTVTIAACSSGGETPGSTTGGDDLVVKIGVMEANNPTFQEQSDQAKLGAEVAVEMIDPPEGMSIEMVPIETDGTPANAVQALSRAVREDGVTFVTGFTTSAMSGAISAQADQLGIVQLDTISKDASLVGANCTANLFHPGLNSTMYTRAGIKIAAESGVEKWDLIGPDDAFGHSSVESFAGALTDAGYEIENQIFAVPGSSDFAPYISTLANSDANGLFVVFAASDSVTFANQARDFGLFDKYEVLLSQGLVVPSTLPATGTALERFADIFPWVPTSDAPGAAEFAAAFKEKSGGIEAWYVPADIYSAFQVAVAATEAAGSLEPDALVEAISGQTFDTVSGSWTIRPEDHQAERELTSVEVQIEGDKAVIVETGTIAKDDSLPDPNPECSL
jgi:branched-chain amino acid transport system substrate-binding protein